MATLTSDDILDLAKVTQRHLGKFKFQQIAQSITDFPIMRVWFRKDRMTMDSGKGIQRTLMLKTGNVAKEVGLFETDDINVADLLEQMTVPWRRVTAHYAWERRELLENRGEALILNVIQPRRAAAMLDVVELLETRAWGTAPTSTDKLKPYNIPYWIVKSATTGFNGGAATGNTTVAGINPTTYPKFKNYTGTWVGGANLELTESAGMPELRTAHRKVKFRAPTAVKDYRSGGFEKYQLYVNETGIQDFEDLARANNQNHGPDVSMFDDRTTFRRHTINYVPKLDDDSTNPIYLIDHSTFHPVVLKGDYLRETSPEWVSNQHNTLVVHIDLSYNYVCIDRRRNAVLYAVAS